MRGYAPRYWCRALYGFTHETHLICLNAGNYIRNVTITESDGEAIINRMIALGGRLHTGYMVDAVDGFLSCLNIIPRRVELAIPFATFEERALSFHGHGF